MVSQRGHFVRSYEYILNGQRAYNTRNPIYGPCWGEMRPPIRRWDNSVEYIKNSQAAISNKISLQVLCLWPVGSSEKWVVCLNLRSRTFQDALLKPSIKKGEKLIATFLLSRLLTLWLSVVIKSAFTLASFSCKYEAYIKVQHLEL